MKQVIVKYSFILFTVFLTLTACVKDMEIDIPDTHREIVVACLFNPQDKWELTLSETKLLVEDEDIFIDDASVEITSETGENITLTYSGENGLYISDEYPESGRNYTLKVNIPGHKVITAKSKVPNFVKATVPDFEIKWIKYLYPNNLMDYDAFPLEVNFGETIQEARFLFRAQNFDPRYGYNRYMLTSESLEKLEQEGLPGNASKELLRFVDQWQISQREFDKILFDFVGDFNLRQRLLSLLHKEIKQKSVPTRENEAFRSTVCFGNDFWLNNISYDVTTVIGEGENIGSANLLYANANLKYSMENSQKRNVEFWLEITQGSKDYIDYYRSYILQVSQRINPYSEPVIVHTNLKNATGIFAGYNRQMVLLFTY